jgi:PEP-CTERM motif
MRSADIKLSHPRARAHARDALSALDADTVFATLLPILDASFNVQFDALGLTQSFAGLHPARGEVLYLAPVPEPSTYALMLGGLCAVGWLARRRIRLHFDLDRDATPRQLATLLRPTEHYCLNPADPAGAAPVRSALRSAASPRRS